MNNQLTLVLERRFNELIAAGGMGADTIRNALKEELQFYVLDFIYHHPVYNAWIMYGGSALRIIHGLDRMSVDLDFEISPTVTSALLVKLKKELETYFADTYGAGTDLLTIKIAANRGLLLKFLVDEKLSAGNASKQVHVKIDLNHFVASRSVTERRPINRDQLSFVIRTYNLSALMASKLAAIFLRGKRGVGEFTYNEKGRDIYDLLWYMNQRVLPDFDYLRAKGIDFKDPRTLFDNLTVQMNKVSETNLKHDLSPLFADQTQITHWLQNWRESYLRLLDDYRISTVTKLDQIEVRQDFLTQVYTFVFRYKTTEGGLVRIVYTISDYWFDRPEGALPVAIKPWSGSITSRLVLTDTVKQYMTLFHLKTEKYLKKNNRIILGDLIATKLIRLTVDNLNQQEQIVLNRSALLSCELDDLLR